MTEVRPLSSPGTDRNPLPPRSGSLKSRVCGIGISAVPSLPKAVRRVRLPYPAFSTLLPPPARASAQAAIRASSHPDDGHPHSRPVRRPGGRAADRPAFAHRPAPPRRPGLSTTSSATTTTPNWPTPAGMRQEPRSTRTSTPASACRAILRTWTASTTRPSTAGSSTSPAPSSASRRPRHGRRRRRPVRRRRAAVRAARLGAAGLREDEPRSDLPDQRVRRPARRLRHRAVTSPACGPTRSSSTSTSPTSGERLAPAHRRRGRRRGSRCARRSRKLFEHFVAPRGQGVRHLAAAGLLARPPDEQPLRADRCDDCHDIAPASSGCSPNSAASSGCRST